MRKTGRGCRRPVTFIVDGVREQLDEPIPAFRFTLVNDSQLDSVIDDITEQLAGACPHREVMRAPFKKLDKGYEAFLVTC